MSLDAQLLKLIDALAASDSRNRSNFIANILHKTAYELYTKSRNANIRKLGDAYFKNFF